MLNYTLARMLGYALVNMKNTWKLSDVKLSFHALMIIM